MVAERLGGGYAVVKHIVLWEMRLTVYAKLQHLVGSLPFSGRPSVHARAVSAPTARLPALPMLRRPFHQGGCSGCARSALLSSLR